MSEELYKKHRPSSFKQVVGQEDTVRVLKDLCKRSKLPHTILFTGGSGCGKTTLARILKNELKGGDQDFYEINCADFKGVDMVRNIRREMNLAPIAGPVRVYLIDECHKLTGDAQNAFLKILEDTPKHVYFFLATTDPQKLLKTVKTRCTEFNLKELTPRGIKELIGKVAKKEKVKVSEDVTDKIINVCEGSARKVLVLLNQVIGLKDEDEQLDALGSSDSQEQAINIARALINKKTTWTEMKGILSDVKEDPEGLRYMILGYASSVLLKSQNDRAYEIINCFSSNFYDSKRAGLIAACYEVITGA